MACPPWVNTHPNSEAQIQAPAPTPQGESAHPRGQLCPEGESKAADDPFLLSNVPAREEQRVTAVKATTQASALPHLEALLGGFPRPAPPRPAGPAAAAHTSPCSHESLPPMALESNLI